MLERIWKQIASANVLFARYIVAARPTAMMLANLIKLIASDLIFLVGLICLSVGAAKAWEPLGLITFGAFICVPMMIDRMRRRT